MIPIFQMKKLRSGGQGGEGTSQGHTFSEQKKLRSELPPPKPSLFLLNHTVLSDLGKTHLSKM